MVYFKFSYPLLNLKLDEIVPQVVVKSDEIFIPTAGWTCGRECSYEI